jgi:cystathionine beta-lyase
LSADDDDAARHVCTRLAHLGNDPASNHGVVNPPVYRASTILFPSLDAYEEGERTPFDGTRYGRRGTPTTFALEDAVARLEGGYRSVAVPSGLAAITLTLMAFLKAGDHLLMVDTVYGPTRRFCESVLKGLGIETTYYNPIAGIDGCVRANTRLVFCESPGSLTFEVQDIPRLAAAARAAGVITAIDNTYGAGLLFNAFAAGVDISIQAATKYIVGHSDVMMGLITTTEETFLRVRRATAFFGSCVSPDDCYAALRGLRTLGVRLPRHEATALRVARWLQGRPEVAHVRHPALADCPGHDVWRRDFSGSNGLLAFTVHAPSRAKLAAFIDGLELFGLGASWGGYESLIVPFDPAAIRTCTPWPHAGPAIRLHCGLEEADDLIADLDRGFAQLAAAS